MNKTGRFPPWEYTPTTPCSVLHSHRPKAPVASTGFAVHRPPPQPYWSRYADSCHRQCVPCGSSMYHPGRSHAAFLWLPVISSGTTVSLSARNFLFGTLSRTLFRGIPPDPLSGKVFPGPLLFGALPRTLFALAAKGSSFLSHGRKKRSKESPPAARISVKIGHCRLKRKNSELCSSDSLRFLTPTATRFS